MLREVAIWLNETSKVVFSRTLKEATWSNTRPKLRSVLCKTTQRPEQTSVPVCAARPRQW